jgi:hypothetical protein
MATITISNLSMAGSDLFSDTESYLDEVSNNDLLKVTGGFSTTVCFAIGFSTAVTVGISAVASAARFRNENKK